MKLIILLLIFFQSLFSEVIIDSGTKRVNSFDLHYYHDNSALKTIEDISKHTFSNKNSNQMSLKYKKGFVWFKIKIINKSENSRFVIKAFESLYEIYNLYEYKDDKWIIHKNGLNININEMEIKNRFPIIPLDIQMNETKTLYIQVSSVFPFIIDFEIFEYDYFFKYFDSKYDSLYMFYFGSLFIIILFNMFLFITIKDMIYGYYIGYTFFFGMFVFVTSGFDITIGLQNWHYYFYTSPAFFIGFFILFTNEILNIKYYNKYLTYILYIMATIFFSFSILILLNIAVWFQILAIFSTISFIGLLFISFYIGTKNNVDAKIYFFALIFYLISMVMFSAMTNGWISNNSISRYSYLYASFIEIIIFSLMLASRFYRLNKEKIKTLNKLREKEKLLQERNRLAQMGEMINMIAHQWRQPLGAINSALFVVDAKLKMNKFDLSNEEDKKDFFKLLESKQKNISEYVQFLSTTIDDFRNFFKQDKQKQEHPISNCIKKALYIVSASMESNGINIVEEYEVNPCINIYQNEIIQVILNILKNSEDCFLEKNIQNRKIVINMKKKDLDLYSICICDNAGGINKDIITKIFDPYFSTKLERNGTGLGLYISKIIIEKHHNGELNVYNHEDGVCFEIVLNKH